MAVALIVWRKSVARKKEIKRLLVLAEEEATWAEREASFGYEELFPRRQLQPRENWCAVCYCPTTTRCSQCKAVRYWYVCLFSFSIDPAFFFSVSRFCSRVFGLYSEGFDQGDLRDLRGWKR